jgi:UPF0716 protein FxsA
MRLLLLLVVTPIIELFLLVKMSEFTGWPFTILLTIVTGVVGSRLAKRQGWMTFQRIQQEMSGGRMPTDSLIDAFMILAAGLMLMTPGILTDLAGFSLLIPTCRRLYRGWLIAWFKRNVRVQTFSSQTFSANFSDRDMPQSDDVIDSYVVEKRNEDD